MDKKELDKIRDEINSGRRWGWIEIYACIRKQRKEITQLREALCRCKNDQNFYSGKAFDYIEERGAEIERLREALKQIADLGPVF